MERKLLESMLQQQGGGGQPYWGATQPSMSAPISSPDPMVLYRTWRGRTEGQDEFPAQAALAGQKLINLEDIYYWAHTNGFDNIKNALLPYILQSMSGAQGVPPTAAGRGSPVDRLSYELRNQTLPGIHRQAQGEKGITPFLRDYSPDALAILGRDSSLPPTMSPKTDRRFK
jgi:hypothetical protein